MVVNHWLKSNNFSNVVKVTLASKIFSLFSLKFLSTLKLLHRQILHIIDNFYEKMFLAKRRA